MNTKIDHRSSLRVTWMNFVNAWNEWSMILRQHRCRTIRWLVDQRWWSHRNWNLLWSRLITCVDRRRPSLSVQHRYRENNSHRSEVIPIGPRTSLRLLRVNPPNQRRWVKVLSFLPNALVRSKTMFISSVSCVGPLDHQSVSSLSNSDSVNLDEADCSSTRIQATKPRLSNSASCTSKITPVPSLKALPLVPPRKSSIGAVKCSRDVSNHPSFRRPHISHLWSPSFDRHALQTTFTFCFCSNKVLERIERSLGATFSSLPANSCS